MKARIHEGHLGIERCKTRARECLIWPGITIEIADMISRCDMCIQARKKQQREPLMPLPPTTRAWSRVAYDLFQMNRRDYLLIVDYHTSYPENTDATFLKLLLKTKADCSDKSEAFRDDAAKGILRYLEQQRWSGSFIEGSEKRIRGVSQDSRNQWVVFIDTNPSFSIYTEIALAAANKLIIPINADDFSKQAVRAMLDLVYGIPPDDQPDDFQAYRKYTFSHNMKEYKLDTPKIHLLINNRATTIRKNTAKVFKLMGNENLSVLHEAYQQHPECFTSCKAEKRSNSFTASNLAFVPIIQVQKAIEDHEYSCGIFLDFSKAFDTLNHEILLAKLEFYGIRGIVKDWFTSYLSNMKQFVSLGNTLSGRVNISFGIPQGSEVHEKKKREESRKRLQREERSKTYDDYDWTLVYREGQLRKLKVPSLDLYLDKHGISCTRSTLKQDKLDTVVAHIARSIINNDAINNEEDDVEDEESDEEYRDDVVLEEIGGESDGDETTKNAQQIENDEDDSEDNDNSDYGP
ncbi:Uncharacterized protein K02A2.6 [Stylophora pistillata]|uniref:Uncharacterized protein K02A2.6 n=1 Tax=Stylophora pistillata TaxID=50429 RepID=A0A2B4S5N9_STYPI|nr:Uncharacterized protein K02A2.6 [Stylophora pistillata]